MVINKFWTYLEKVVNNCSPPLRSTCQWKAWSVLKEFNFLDLNINLSFCLDPVAPYGMNAALTCTSVKVKEPMVGLLWWSGPWLCCADPDSH